MVAAAFALFAEVLQVATRQCQEARRGADVFGYRAKVEMRIIDFLCLIVFSYLLGTLTALRFV